MLGSPALRINGHDVEPAADDRTDYGGSPAEDLSVTFVATRATVPMG